MEEKKDKLAGIVGTSVFHVIILLLLLFVYLEVPDYGELTEWGGVPVMFGNVEDAFGDDEPFGRGAPKGTTTAPNELAVNIPPEESTVPPATLPKADDDLGEPVATQDVEETIAINEAENKAREEAARKKAETDRQKRVEEQKAKAEADRIAAEAAKKKQQQEQISNQMAGLFGNGSGSGSRGETEGTGTQGVPTGNASYGKTSGVGGWGTFDLGGRSLGSGGLIKPNYSEDDYGTVVVDIVVNPAGAVVEASIGKGTNTPSSSLKQEALRAAKRTRFNNVKKVGNQTGKITYKFNLN